MKLFIIIFSLALLFVIGTAGMMRYFDNKNVIRKHDSSTDDEPKDH